MPIQVRSDPLFRPLRYESHKIDVQEIMIAKRHLAYWRELQLSCKASKPLRDQVPLYLHGKGRRVPSPYILL